MTYNLLSVEVCGSLGIIFLCIRYFALCVTVVPFQTNQQRCYGPSLYNIKNIVNRNFFSTAITRSVDVTITNFLEGVTPYTSEPEGPSEAGPSTSRVTPRYVTPAPTGVFPKSAKERQLSFQERKAQMIAEARKRYMEKHGLSVALNNC